MEHESMKIVASGKGFTSDFLKRFPLSHLPTTFVLSMQIEAIAGVGVACLLGH